MSFSKRDRNTRKSVLGSVIYASLSRAPGQYFFAILQARITLDRSFCSTESKLILLTLGGTVASVPADLHTPILLGLWYEEVF